jgi:hypothetical protein
MAVLKRLDFLEEVMVDELFSPLGEMDLLYYASDIMEKLGCEQEDEIDNAIQRVVQVCQSLNIPLKRNFKRIYRYDGNKMSTDWKLSSLASYLLMINGNPCNPNVAKAQLFFAVKNSNHSN